MMATHGCICHDIPCPLMELSKDKPDCVQCTSFSCHRNNSDT